MAWLTGAAEAVSGLPPGIRARLGRMPLTGDERGDTFVGRFDHDSGRLMWLEGMRHRDANDDAKTLWFAITAYRASSAL